MFEIFKKTENFLKLFLPFYFFSVLFFGFHARHFWKSSLEFSSGFFSAKCVTLNLIPTFIHKLISFKNKKSILYRDYEF